MKKLILTKPPEIKITYSYKGSINSLPKVTSPKEVYEVLRSIWNKDTICHREEMIVLMLNHSCRVLGYHTVGVGGLTYVTGDPRIMFQAALKANATAIIVAHNHPAGVLQPSKQDLNHSRRIREIGDILGIEVLDNVIITKEGFKSFE
jgi:DNA repair protein RadC